MARKSRKNTQQPVSLAPLCLPTAIYIRLSVEDNKMRGASVEIQKMILGEFVAKKPELEIYDIYIDNGATGTNFQRPGFQQMLSDIEAGYVKCVVVKDLSRLGRNAIDTGYYIEQYFPAHGVRFIAVTDQFDSADPGILHIGIILPLKNLINAAYSLDIGRKIKSQARQAMRDGDYVGGRAPYGYRKDPQNCHKLLIDEEAAAVVRQIFQWAYERVSVSEIVRRLNEQGVMTPSHYKRNTGEITHENLVGAGKWQTRTINKILDSEVYTGDLVQGKTKTVDHRQMKADEDNYIIARGTHEPVVSHEMFDAVRAYRRELREEYKGGKPYTPNILKGKVFCAHCGRNLNRMRASRKKMADTYRFYCISNNRIGKGACESFSIREDELLAAVAQVLEKELAPVVNGSVTLLGIELQQQEERIRLNSAIKTHAAEIDRLRLLIRSLYENLVSGALSKADYFSMKDAYEGKIAGLTKGVNGFEKRLSELDDVLQRYRAIERDAASLTQERGLTAELVDRLIERIEVSSAKEINVTFRFHDAFTAYLEGVGA